MSLLPKIQPRSEAQKAADAERSLLRYEAEVGSRLFGKVPKGHRRQFFCLDKNTWIWHEEWKNTKGVNQSVTTRYEITPSGILKIQDGKTYQKLSAQEAKHLAQATHLYREKVVQEYDRVLGKG